MDAAVLSVTRANKHFGELAAVTVFGFDAQASEAFGLMEPNRAGKSAPLNIMSAGYKL